MPHASPPAAKRFVATMTLLGWLTACSAMVDATLSDKQSESASGSTAAGGSGAASGQGGAAAAGATGGSGGTAPDIQCGSVVCSGGETCCMLPGQPLDSHCAASCQPQEVSIACSEQEDCPDALVCCAYFDINTQQPASVECVAACNFVPDLGVLLCNSGHESLCKGVLSCQDSVKLPEPIMVCS